MSEEIMELEQVEVCDDLAYFNEVEAGLTILETKYAVVPDITTPEGKEAIRKGLAEMRPLRTSVDKRRLKLGKKLRQELKDINTTGNRIIDRIKIIEDPYKIAKMEGEKAEAEAEAKRILDIKTRIHLISIIIEQTESQNSIEITDVINEITKKPLSQDFEEFQEEAEAVMIDVVTRLRKRLGIVKQAEAEAEIQRLEAIRLKEENEKLETDKAKANDAEKVAEIRIAAKEADAEARIKKMEDDAQARIDAMNDKLEAVTEKVQEVEVDHVDKDLAEDLIDSAVKTIRNTPEPLPRLLNQEEIEENLKQHAQQSTQQTQPEQPEQQAYQMPSFGNREEESEAENPITQTTAKQVTEEQNKATTKALRRETGMGARMARVILDAVRDNKIPHLTWAQ